MLKKLMIDMKDFFFSKKVQLTRMKTAMSEMKNILARLITDQPLGKKKIGELDIAIENTQKQVERDDGRGSDGDGDGHG